MRCSIKNKRPLTLTAVSFPALFRALFRALSCLTMMLAAVHTAQAGSSGDAKKQVTQKTHELIDAFKAVRVAEEGGSLSADDTKANEAIFLKLDRLLDLDLFAREAIQPKADEFKNRQKEKVEYMKLFVELVRAISYPRSGKYLSKAELTFGDASPGKDGRWAVPVRTYLADDDFRNLVAFIWKQDTSSSVWSVVDVEFDGASLIKDYQNQFGGIIGKSGVEGLLDKIRRKHKSTVVAVNGAAN